MPSKEVLPIIGLVLLALGLVVKKFTKLPEFVPMIMLIVAIVLLLFGLYQRGGTGGG